MVYYQYITLYNNNTNVSKQLITIHTCNIFALSPKGCVLSGEATNTNLIVFGLTRPGLEQTIYRTRGVHANHYATDVVVVLSVLV
jgi:hypothetical protein